MIPLRLLLPACCLLLVGCDKDKTCLDRQSRAIFAGATRVEVFRLGTPVRPVTKPKEKGEKRFGGFEVTAQGADQGRQFADKLAAILSDEKTYTDRFAKCFDPGVGYRIWKGTESVEVLICFKCGNLYCGPPTENAQENAAFNGSPREADLRKLAMEAFPDDKEIQALGESKSY
jgi:hypothetical protein